MRGTFLKLGHGDLLRPIRIRILAKNKTVRQISFKFDLEVSQVSDSSFYKLGQVVTYFQHFKDVRICQIYVFMRISLFWANSIGILVYLGNVCQISENYVKFIEK